MRATPLLLLLLLRATPLLLERLLGERHSFLQLPRLLVHGRRRGLLLDRREAALRRRRRRQVPTARGRRRRAAGELRLDLREGRPRVGLVVPAPPHQRDEVRGRVAVDRRPFLLNAHLHHDLHLIEARPWRISGQHLEDDHAVGVHVALFREDVVLE